MKARICFASLLLALASIMGCGDRTYNGTCNVSGTIRNYKNLRLALFEITPSQNYFISKVEISSSGKFEVEFKAKEKSIYALSNGRDFIYFVNDVPDLIVETSQDELDNYQVEDSPESEQLRQLVATHKKLATEVTLAERLLVTKMVKTHARFGSDPEMLDLENKADKRSLELRSYIVNFMDTVQDKLLAIAASSLLNMQEDFNYMELFTEKMQGAAISARQKNDLKIELENARRSFQSIAPLSEVGGMAKDGKLSSVSFKGKYVFINIWASWCYLSRANLPFIKEAFEKLKQNDNLVFVNVSIDEDVAEWKKFLEKEQFNVPNQLCDSLGKDAPILKRFGLEYIPANFVLDTNGSIITSNLRDKNVLATLEGVLRNKPSIEKK